MSIGTRVTVAALVVGFAAIGCGGADSASNDGRTGRTTSTTVDATHRRAATLCRIALRASLHADQQLGLIAWEHIEAFNHAATAIRAEVDGDHTRFIAEAAAFRAYVATEQRQAERIATVDTRASAAMRECRDALGADRMPPACEQWAGELADFHAHILEGIASADELYAAAEQTLAGIERGDESSTSDGVRRIEAARTTWEAAMADDEQRLDAITGGWSTCDI